MSPLRPTIRSAPERVVRAVLAGAALVVVIAIAYALVILALGRAPDAGERTLLALSAAATAAVALAYPRVRERAVTAARPLSRSSHPPLDAPLRVFSGRLSRSIPLEELLLQTAETLRRALRLRSAEIWTGAGGELQLAVADPARERAGLSLATEQPIVAREGVAGEGFARVWLAPLLVGRKDAVLRVAPAVRAGEVLGLIVVERTASGPQFTEREDEMLGSLARQVALVLHNARLDSALQESLETLRRRAEELRVSRARIVASANAERRRIERDLHDGTQQRLVALMARLGELRDDVSARDGEALAAVEELERELEATIEELREVAHGIYPPLLADAGLAEAITAAAARAPLRCRVDADGLARHSPEVESALYFCCLEALQNAVKHAGRDATVTIRLEQRSGRLGFTVEDDGVGFDPSTPRAGIGLTNMADRLGALGGQLEVDSAPGGGTRVRGSLPVSPQPPASER